MTIPVLATDGVIVRSLLGMVGVLLFLVSVAVLAMHIRHRRWKRFPATVLLLVLTYVFAQCMLTAFVLPNDRYPRAMRLVWAVLSLPWPALMGIFAAVAAAEALLFREVLLYEYTHINSMSVKEATDSLPSGLCFFTPDGRILMANRSMERFCRAAVGTALLNGERFRSRLFSGDLCPGCEFVPAGDTPVIVLPDGTAWSVSLRENPYGDTVVSLLMANDITEIYGKTAELRAKQEELSGLNERLAELNREIVDLTVQREILNAKVRIHDELGSSLLSIKQYILNGGTERELQELRTRLGQSVSLIRAEAPAMTRRDEYELMFRTAETLGVHIRLTGELPRTEPHKHVLAMAIHECITNTLRHAHGNELCIECRTIPSPGGETIAAKFTNNGEQPAEEIREKGGLRSLRTMAEDLGGTMTVRSLPEFSITLELPKEVTHVL